MNHTQQRKRRAATMPAHAMQLTFRHQASDRRDAHNMSVFTRLRASTTARARMKLLAGSEK